MIAQNSDTGKPSTYGKRNRRREVSNDWEANVSDESASASGNRSITEPPATGIVGKSGDSLDNGQTDHQNGKRREKKKSTKQSRI